MSRGLGDVYKRQIERYPREYAEEISAEITDLAKKAEYAGIPMDKLQEVIDKVNRKNG